MLANSTLLTCHFIFRSCFDTRLKFFTYSGKLITAEFKKTTRELRKFHDAKISDIKNASIRMIRYEISFSD